MVISGYIIKPPYWLVWHTLKVFGKLCPTAFYVDSLHDYHLVESVLPYIKSPYKIIARNKKTATELKNAGINATSWPAFPQVLIMTRHAFHRFPIKAIKKIGLRHGPYHFKKMIHHSKYNAFDMFLFTSQTEVEKALKLGITNGVPGGYPRLDVFKSRQAINKSIAVRNESSFYKDKTTLLFTATWDRSGLSAVDKWIGHLDELKDKYNVFVSLHPMMSEVYFNKIKKQKNVCLVSSKDLPVYMLASDYLVSDTSSVIAEYCSLDKGIITFKLKAQGRLTNEICEMIKDVSIQIDDVEEIDAAVKQYKENPDLKRAEREKWSKMFFDDVSVSHGEKAAKYINSFIEKNTAG